MGFPRDVEALSKSKTWCIKALQKNNIIPAGAEITHYQVTALNQAVIFRSNAGILEITYNHQGKSNILKCFVKFAPTMGSIWNRTIFNIQANHVKEAWFNQYFVNTNDGVPAPKVYFSDISVITGNLCLITEFMEDCIEYRESGHESFPEKTVDYAIEGMASLHARYWKSTDSRMKRIIPIEESTVLIFDFMVRNQWSNAARKVLVHSWILMNEPETVLHGDSRIGNMMFPSSEGKGRFVFIDWQAARKGKAVFDLAYFIVLSLTTKYRQSGEQQFVEKYYRLLQDKGVKNYTIQAFDEDYKHACLCVLVLLALPMLSGEFSADGHAAQIFVFGMDIWRARMDAKFKDFDYAWMADRYLMTEAEARSAVKEMLTVIEDRLADITKQNTFSAELEAMLSPYRTV
jgi:hypothetical protein